MYNGTMIEELMEMVERAERRAYLEAMQAAPADLAEPWMLEPAYATELAGVA